MFKYDNDKIVPVITEDSNKQIVRECTVFTFNSLEEALEFRKTRSKGTGYYLQKYRIFADICNY